MAAAEVTALEARFGRALRGNVEGQAIIAAAIEQAVSAGFEAWPRAAPEPDEDLSADEVWTRWQAQRRFTPEARRWPERLARSGDENATAALARAEQALLAAGGELGMTGAVGGRRARRALVDTGRQAAEAGAALRCALEEGDRPVAEAAVATPAAAPRRVVAGEAVRIATAANSAECEMLQGMLENAGIPSTWRRSGGDAPHFMAAGDRDILVPAAAVEEARVLLATVEPPDEPEAPAEARTGPVGLERPTLRRFGKLTVVLWVAGAIGIPTLVAAIAGVTGALVAGAAAIAVIVAVVVWSERGVGDGR